MAPGRPVRVATWNVNGLVARLEAVVAWLRHVRPAVLCLQETKVVDAKFPFAALAEVGYHACALGQPAYNGVAVLSSAPVARLTVAAPAPDGPAARLVACETHGLVVMSAYVPNGQRVGSPKWAYKLAWLEALAEMLARHFDPAARLLIAGDMNVAPTDADVADPRRWAETVLCHPEARAALAAVRAWGLVDTAAGRAVEDGPFTWWDYREASFARDHGLRIDHLLMTRALAAEVRAVGVDRAVRAGVRPSDHAPVWATLGPAT